MKKISLVAILFIGCTLNSFAQTDNTAPAKEDKVTEQFIGVQLNGLIRQVFNFNNSTASTSVNPYLLTYNINFKKSGWGLRVGVGYNYTSTSSDDGITATANSMNDLQARLGIEKAFKLSDHWSAGAGLDAVLNTNNDNTSSTVHSTDTVTTANKSVGTGIGGGPMAWLRYAITSHILIGTEASFYYVSTSQKNTVTITDRTFDPFGNSIITTTETTSKPKTAQGTFNSPIVFYISIKF